MLKFKLISLTQFEGMLIKYGDQPELTFTSFCFTTEHGLIMAEFLAKYKLMQRLTFKNCQFTGLSFEKVVDALRGKEGIGLYFVGDIVIHKSLKYLAQRSLQLVELGFQGGKPIELIEALKITEFIKGCPTLKKIALAPLSEQAVNVLSDFFESSKTVTDLEIRDTGFANHSGEKLAELFAANESIQRLALYNCDLDNESLVKQAAAMADNFSLLEIKINDIRLSIDNVHQFLITQDYEAVQSLSTIASHLHRNQALSSFWPQIERATETRDILKTATLLSELGDTDCPQTMKSEIIEGFWNLQITDIPVKMAHYRLMLWLLREEQSSTFCQQIILTCVEQLQAYEKQCIVDPASIRLELYQDEESQTGTKRIVDVTAFMAKLYAEPTLALLEKDQALLNRYAWDLKIWSVPNNVLNFFKSIWSSAGRYLEPEPAAPAADNADAMHPKS
ncbi:hypothetical protein Lbir_2640 [Legionella birminghamensis]|uniref:Ran GTPase-activating protein (RanGAP) involved in mRNA processing and transport n=1 Tax=Legionella birminghamensis TaxID=28083 RepID=A0A378I880_9GAMM|nr:hypothetical protein [Legionella birminghamensis]KTC68038.1 hypothetical protein Lbir_2640 [Legionella birminghamensis]STX31253.1 Uncharacterised protein [Legionella birminghamensis]